MSMTMGWKTQVRLHQRRFVRGVIVVHQVYWHVAVMQAGRPSKPRTLHLVAGSIDLRRYG